MKSVTKSIDSQFKLLVKNIDHIIDFFDTSINKQDGYTYQIDVSGDVHFHKAQSDYNFEALSDLREFLAIENLNDVWFWTLNIEIKEYKADEKWKVNDAIDVTFRSNSRFDVIDMQVRRMDYTRAVTLMDGVIEILKTSYAEIADTDPEAENEERRILAEQKIIHLFENLPDYQSRISKELDSEKSVQEFLYPILKSHFSDLQEEDYLSKVAGAASKPDFGIESLGIAIEVKYTSKSTTLKKMSDEISIDSRRYFGKSSPFKSMIVIIYNGNQEPTPANYTTDLEHIDVISKVVISPKIIPKS